MNILILAGGYGTRLYPLIIDKPKALLDVNNRALIDYAVERVIHWPDVNIIYVVTNNKFYQHLKDWAKGQKKILEKICIVNDKTETPETRLGSIGDINFVLKNEKPDDDLLVMGSDNLFDYALDDFITFARKNSPSGTIGLYDIRELEGAKKFGVVALDHKGKILSFEEKPKEPKSSLIAMCLYYFPKKTLGLIQEYLIESRKSDMAGDYIRWLCGRQDVYGFKFSGLWFDIGSIESYQEAQKYFKPKP